MTISIRGQEILFAAAKHPNGELAYRWSATSPTATSDLEAMVEVERAGLLAYARLERGGITVFKLTALGRSEQAGVT